MVRALPQRKLGVSLVDQAQAAQGQQRVHFVDGLAVGSDRRRQTAGRDEARALAKLARDPAVDPVHQAGEAEGEPRLDRRGRVLADRRRGSAMSMRGSFAVRAVSASSEISTPGPITPPRYSPPETTSKLVEVPKSTATQAPFTRACAATALTSRSAPSSCGLSTRINVIFTWGPTIIPRSPRCRSQKRSYSGPSCGTTVETIAPSRLSKESPSSASSPETRIAIWSEVAWRSVASRQSWASSSPSKAPR